MVNELHFSAVEDSSLQFHPFTLCYTLFFFEAVAFVVMSFVQQQHNEIY